MENIEINTELKTIPEAAKFLRVSERTIHRLIAEDKLHAPKIRRRRFVSRASLEKALEG